MMIYAKWVNIIYRYSYFQKKKKTNNDNMIMRNKEQNPWTNFKELKMPIYLPIVNNVIV